MNGVASTAHATTLLNRHACGWIVPRDIVFDRPKLSELLMLDERFAKVERFKAVLRTGINHWTLFNKSAAGVSTESCGWRQDSRIEVQMCPHARADWMAWDVFWNGVIAK